MSEFDFVKYDKEYDSSNQNCNITINYLDWLSYKTKLGLCMTDCEAIYEKIKGHQTKGAEISYYTFEKQINKCKNFKSEDPVKLLSCYNYKVGKLAMRFGSYYLNQKMNLIERIDKLY